jgi:PTH1 family peptidyl-tRNA hydrolase
MWIVAGLGNPGKQYLYTWHNMGYLAVDMLADKHGIFLGKEKYKGLWGKGKIAGQDVIIIKPTTYMNNSGECLAEISKFYKVEPKNIITVYDDIDIAKGTIRVRPKGSAGTHNGMRSVIQLLGTQDFPRVRIGTGPVPEHWDLVNYVLSEVPQDERKLLNDAFVKACEAVEEIISNG